jgi:hypothetical protein
MGRLLPGAVLIGAPSLSISSTLGASYGAGSTLLKISS